MILRLEPPRDEWSRLAQASGNVFGTPEWAETWWRHFGRGRRLLTGGAWDGERLAAVLPLYVARERPVRVLRFVGHGPGDQLGPVCAAADLPLAADALKEAARLARADILLGEQLPGGYAWPGRVLRRTGSPVLRFEGVGSWDELLAGWSSNLRQRARREPRRLERGHTLVLRGSGDLDADLDTLFRLHAARWQGGSTFVDEQFHRDFARISLERGWLRFWLLELDGRPAAAWYGFRYAGAESYYQAGRDPSLDRYSVGFVLLVHTIRAALEDGAREYRFLRGGEGYKYRFTGEDPGLKTVGIGCSALGTAALAVARVLAQPRLLRLARAVWRRA